MAVDYMTFKERMAHRTYFFPVIVEGNFQFDMRRVYPLKQREVATLLEEIKNDDDVLEVWLFGSAPTMCCNIHSDLDVAVRTKSGEYWSSDLPRDVFSNGVDFVNLNHIKPGSKLYDNIMKGIKIYEQVKK